MVNALSNLGTDYELLRTDKHIRLDIDEDCAGCAGASEFALFVMPYTPRDRQS